MTYLHEAQKTFPLSIAAPRAARRWLHASGVVPPALLDAVDLVVSELVTNSVTHSGLAEPDVVSVRVASFPGGVTGEVIDEGRGMGDDPPRTAPSMGLRLVEGTVSRWGHTDHPTRVWFELTVRQTPRWHRPAA
ncbi:MAG TPA: ATP-binding protein [Actinomycetota bacterium]|jgi:two-component sensor histidine kinase|nr:ATP-binding protein [Actinomycetota bacterium]